MSAPIALRDDYDGAHLRRLAQASSDANQPSRLLSLALIYDGASRGQAASLGGVTHQIIRDWVQHFNAQGPDGLLDRKAPGDSPTYGEQESTAYNGHFGCTCYCPLFLFNQIGDLERCALRPGDVHSAQALPHANQQWSPTTLRVQHVKLGARIVHYDRYIIFQMAEVAIPRELFADILRGIDRLRPTSAPV